ncbi:TVP38/TMEM64 family protein [Paenibacillus allorhizosphaerae]|uniref:TVP38/TMEM64 family membrane protein n=1 Tax=Paenibacillus allorhizosphaerae TaxID=2849866 RepID=A0ABM8VSV8_9BACL|nr:VTT domain-containing protein [Paenibacillus allorhizosphaerae]CAG7657026.1 hypothetical protein PAECIP111802_06590 [Paenibacillus allorhizosphaerae]
MSRWIWAAAYAAAVAASFYFKDEILDWVRNSDRSQLVPMTLMALFLALVPVIPYGIVAGLMGAKFGLIAGSFINLLASSAAAGIMFVLARFVLQRSARDFLSRFKQLDRFTAVYERNPFIGVLFARLIPIIPSPAVNIYSAITRMSWMAFMTATVIGKVPVMLIFAFVGEHVFSNMRSAIIAISVYVVFLLIVYITYLLWRKRSLSS